LHTTAVRTSLILDTVRTLSRLFFQAEDGIRDPLVTGVQTCALPISRAPRASRGRGLSVVAWASSRSASVARGVWVNRDHNKPARVQRNVAHFRRARATPLGAPKGPRR